MLVYIGGAKLAPPMERYEFFEVVAICDHLKKEREV